MIEGGPVRRLSLVAPRHPRLVHLTLATIHCRQSAGSPVSDTPDTSRQALDPRPQAPLPSVIVV